MVKPSRHLSVLLLGAVLVVSACSSSSGSGPSSPAAPASTGSAAPASSAGGSSSSTGSGGQLYVSVGDSYAAGYQATGTGEGGTTTNGFAYQTVTKAKARGYDLQLVNFGCAGATTVSILKSVGCKPSFLGPGAPSYPTQTQAAAAEQYLRAHQGQVALVTVVLGGNDITSCAAEADVLTCLGTALTTVKTNLAVLLDGLREAAGPSTKIVGITYPDVLLGNALSSDAKVKQLAQLSVAAFKSLINPTLQAAYAAVKASFVDVTAATGAYGSLTATTKLAPYGRIPVPVAKICTLTFYCQYQDIHPRTNGYAIIAGLVAAQLPKR